MKKIAVTSFVALFFCTTVLLVSRSQASARTPTCDALPPKTKALSRELFSAMHPYDGCDQTFERCLAKKPAHPIVLRLAEDICRQLKEGKSREAIERAMAKRAQSMLSMGKPAVIELDQNTRVGNPLAPVKAVVYACARCPFCKVLVPALHEAVVSGPLKNKVQLYFRPFPLKDHPGSLEGGLAMVGAGKLGKFWPYLLLLYKNYDSFCPRAFPDWAASIGIDSEAFEREYKKIENRNALVASKQEGIRNKVNATPSLFINGRKYVYELSVKATIDALLEEYERLTESARRAP
ncbi:MAG: thioredoxin domain-containing protein [Deltaproteobacteria bacterium]|nr:thioredoxin domain-containing protein [Deltaproteobacteria bacterium]